MTQKIEVRQPNANFDLVVKEGLPELYVDGASSVAIGFPMSKILLHTVMLPVNQPITPPEQREAVTRLVVPTAALLELALTTLKHAAQVKGQLVAGSATISAQISNFLDQLPDLESSPDNRNDDSQQSK